MQTRYDAFCELRLWSMFRASHLPKILLPQLTKFEVCQNRLYRIWKENFLKSTCLTPSFICPRSSGNGNIESWCLPLTHHTRYVISCINSWTKWPPFRRRLFHLHFCERKSISIQISLKFVPKGPTDNKSALVPEIAWHRTGDKPSPEPMLTQFTNANMWH